MNIAVYGNGLTVVNEHEFVMNHVDYVIKHGIYRRSIYRRKCVHVKRNINDMSFFVLEISVVCVCVCVCVCVYIYSHS